MALEDRIRHSVDAALPEVTARLDQEIRSLVDQLISVALADRDEALAAARQEGRAAGQADTARAVAAAEAQVQLGLDAAVSAARDDERTRTAIEVRRLVEAETEQRIADATSTADARLKLALAEAHARAADQLDRAVTDARARERDAALAAVTRVLESIRQLDAATSLSEVLDALGQAAGREASRAAVLILRNERVLGWKLSGFGARDAEPKAVDLALTEGGVIGLAVGTARPVTTRDSETAAAGPGFAHLPNDRMGFAVPVMVGGRVVAVVYADSLAADLAEHAVPNAWPEVVEVLARHAARCLEALTVQKAAAASAPRFWVAAPPPPASAAAPPSNA